MEEIDWGAKEKGFYLCVLSGYESFITHIYQFCGAFWQKLTLRFSVVYKILPKQILLKQKQHNQLSKMEESEPTKMSDSELSVLVNLTLVGLTSGMFGVAEHKSKTLSYVVWSLVCLPPEQSIHFGYIIDDCSLTFKARKFLTFVLFAFVLVLVSQMVAEIFLLHNCWHSIFILHPSKHFFFKISPTSPLNLKLEKYFVRAKKWN